MQRSGLMPDGSSRFSLGKETIFHYMGTSAFDLMHEGKSIRSVAEL